MKAFLAVACLCGAVAFGSAATARTEGERARVRELHRVFNNLNDAVGAFFRPPK